MIKKLHLSGLIITLIALTGCMKETYDMKRLSKLAQLSPTLAMSAANGQITLSDLIEPNDTIVFGPDKFIKIVFGKDSVVNFKMTDLYDLNDMVYFSKTYTIGEVQLNSFNTIENFTLRQIANNLAEPYKTTFLTLDNTNSVFPPFPSVNLTETVFPLIPNLEYATFSSGTLEFSLKNNLAAPLNGFSISLFNTAGHILIGTASSALVIQPGGTGIASINLADKSVTNSISAAVVLGGSPGNATPALIDIDLSGIEATIKGMNLKLKSGKVILPSQTVNTTNSSDTITFSPGDGIELDEIKLNQGDIGYTIVSPFPVSGSLNVTLPSTLMSGTQINTTLPINGLMSLGSIMVDNAVFDLGSNPDHPFNEIPMIYSFEVSSGGSMVIFNSDDVFTVNLELPNPDIDYVKGYFGKQTELIGPEIMDLDIDDILSQITGDFLVSSPSIKLNYSNSFGVPIKIDLNAAGNRGTKTVDLALDTIHLDYPEFPDRDVSASFTIDKTNSALPELISLPPEDITISGAAVTNSSGRDNYIFGNSRFIGSLEVEVPMEFRFSNFQFADTIDNFMIDENADSDSPIKPENFSMLRLDITVLNGFPLGVSMSMSLYNPTTKAIIRTIDALDILKPATVDANGKVTAQTESKTSIEFTEAFFNDINKADQVIFRFKLNTPGTNAVKFYSDYMIKFNAALVVKPDIIIDLK